MTVRDSNISKAKKLFQKTLQSFKAMLSDGYQRLPKTPPFNPFSCGNDPKLHNSFRELDSRYNNLTDRFGDTPDKEMKKKKTVKKKMKDRRRKQNKEDPYNGSFMKFARFSSIELRDHHHTGKGEDQKTEKEEEEYKEQREEPSSNCQIVDACYTITESLKELEKMDVSNVDHLLDIEEVLHYYSRITCPLYVDIVNKFFMEMYAEFLDQTLKGQLG